MENEFLRQEYSEMFNEKRHYDNRIFLFVTMYFTLLTICISVISFSYESLENDAVYLIIILAIIQMFAGITVAISLYHNRVSLVKACRQINSIRKFCLKNGSEEFFEYNIMPLKSDYPSFLKMSSLHFAVIVFVFSINSICVGVLFFYLWSIIVVSLFLMAITMILQLAIYIFLLEKKDKK